MYLENSPPAAIKFIVRLCIESYKDYMTCVLKIVQATSTRCHNLPTIVYGTWQRASLSKTIEKTFSISERYKKVQARLGDDIF